MSRRRVRGVQYRIRRIKRQATRHFFINEPLPGGGYKITEYRRDRVVGVNIAKGETA